MDFFVQRMLIREGVKKPDIFTKLLTGVLWPQGSRSADAHHISYAHSMEEIVGTSRQKKIGVKKPQSRFDVHFRQDLRIFKTLHILSPSKPIF